jgi:hypothetical protein
VFEQKEMARLSTNVLAFLFGRCVAAAGRGRFRPPGSRSFDTTAPGPDSSSRRLVVDDDDDDDDNDC